MTFTERRSSQNLLGALACILAFVAVSQAKSGKWKVFTHRSGWSISYPPEWKVISCRNCADPTAPDTYAMFLAADADTDAGWVKVDRLEDKPAETTPDAWFDELKTKANLNPRITDTRLTVGALPALKALYRDPAEGGMDIEQVYILAGSQTFSVTFSSTKPGVALANLPNYPVYQQMLESFKVK